MAIRFPCSQCGKRLEAPEELAGKRIRCPECNTVQGVPEEVFEAEPARRPAAEPAYGRPGPAAAAGGDARRPCPMCGEMIAATAAKCRYCGEIFDETLRQAEQRKQKGADTDADMGV